MKPFVKWAGGKRQILQHILNKIKDSTTFENKEDYVFIEPFVGGGAVFLALKHNNVIINDLNRELITAYRTIRDHPLELMAHLDVLYGEYINEEDKDHLYYEIRHQDRNINFWNRNDVEISARMIFLNKTCFNGLYRVNSSGYFNTPIGRGHSSSFYDEKNIKAISRYLNNNNVIIMNDSYKAAMKEARMGDVIYLDPPYDYKQDNGFTGYQKEGFTFNDFLEMKEECDKCLENESTVIISNNRTNKVVDAFKNDKNHRYVIYDIENIDTKRLINCKGGLRNNGQEIIIWGIPCKFPQIKDVSSLLRFIRIKRSDLLNDSEYLKKRFKLSQRTVNYSLSALRYLDIIDFNNQLTEKGLLIKKATKELAPLRLKESILDKPVFKKAYNKDIDLDSPDAQEKIKDFLKIRKDEIAKKRLNLIKSWINWCRSI